MGILQRAADKLICLVGKARCRTFEARLRRRLKNKDFSILSSNCVGGIICKRLGIPFLSPTVGLWMRQDDFLRFILNLQWYLEQELEFVQDPSRSHPVARLGDITLYFTHYKTEADARDCWNRRKARINYDNLYIIMYDRDGVTEADLLKLQDYPCRRKVVFSAHSSSLPYVHTLRSRNAADVQCTDKDLFGIRTFEKQFDYIRFLNSDQEAAPQKRWHLV